MVQVLLRHRQGRCPDRPTALQCIPLRFQGRKTLPLHLMILPLLCISWHHHTPQHRCRQWRRLLCSPYRKGQSSSLSSGKTGRGHGWSSFPRTTRGEGAARSSSSWAMGEKHPSLTESTCASWCSARCCPANTSSLRARDRGSSSTRLNNQTC